ncbi:MAG: S4 domain-containing protein, partial [Cyanobacteria bacterium J06631_2]
MIQEIELQVTETAKRLDGWLAAQLPDISRSRVQKLIENGHIRLNNKICQSKKIKLSLGDHLQVTIPEQEKLALTAENIH